MTIFRVALMGSGAGFLPHLEREILGGEPHPLTCLIGQEMCQVSISMREAKLGPRPYRRGQGMSGQGQRVGVVMESVQMLL